VTYLRAILYDVAETVSCLPPISGRELVSDIRKEAVCFTQHCHRLILEGEIGPYGVANLDCAYHLATMKSTSRMFREVLPKFDDSDGANVVTQLAAAASVGNISIMRQLVNALGKDKFLWDNSFSFGYPLTAAAASNHMEVVKTLTARFENDYRTTPNGEYESGFQSAIDASLTEQHSAMSSLLLEVYHHYFAVLPDKVCDSWLAKTVTDPDDSIILMLGTLRTENASIATSRPLNSPARGTKRTESASSSKATSLVATKATHGIRVAQSPNALFTIRFL
jgi:hypothetical protein